VWESAIAALPEESARLALTVAYAGYLLGRPDSGAGVELLVKVLRTPGVSGPVEADARRLLRGQWRQLPNAVEEAWQSPSTLPVPDWMHLPDDHMNTVINWINTATWAESRGYFHEHSGTLLAGTTPTVLGELSLTASENLISQHRDLLDAVREHGLDAAYRPLLAGEILREWIAAPSWDTSRAFLHDHPDLLNEETPGLLANLTKDPDPAITVHQALLALARTPSGVDKAYQSLDNARSLQDMASAALSSFAVQQPTARGQPGCYKTAALPTELHWRETHPDRHMRCTGAPMNSIMEHRVLTARRELLNRALIWKSHPPAPGPRRIRRSP